MICCSSFFIATGDPVSIKNNNLVKHLIPVPVTLCPLPDYFSAGRIQHLFQRAVAWEYAFCLGYFPVLAVKSFYDVCSIYDAPDIIGKLEEGTDILPVFFPVTDRIGVFLSPVLLDLFQFRQCR